MRSKFRQYYAPNPEEFEDLWNNGVIVLDTNVLFNLYRYSLPTRQNLLETLKHFEERLWIPYRVAFEYQRRRVVEMATHRAVYEKLRVAVDTFEIEMEKKLKQHSRHPILDVGATLEVIKTATGQIKDHISEIEQSHPDLPAGSAPGSDDPIRDLLTAVFEGRVGDPFSEEDLQLIYLQGAERYEAKVPPGYADLGDKEGDEVYGDLIIWKEVIRMAEAQKKPIIFVTDDRKEDWWYRHEGKTIGPRPELIDEIWREAGVLFHMYQPTQFLQVAQTRAASASVISADAVTEVEEVSESDKRHRRELLAFKSDLEDRRRMVSRRLQRATQSAEELDLEVRRSRADSHLQSGRDVYLSKEIAALENEAASLDAQIQSLSARTDLSEEDRLVWISEIENERRRVRSQLDHMRSSAWEAANRHRIDDPTQKSVLLSRRLRDIRKLEAQSAELADRIRELDEILLDDT